MGAGGFEPPKAEPTGLQPVPFGRSGTPPGEAHCSRGRADTFSAMGDPPIRTEQRRKVYGSLVAVDGLDLEVRRGEFFGLLGPNGAGKSTTIGMLTTTVVPTCGNATVMGHDVATAPLAARAVSAVVFQ